MKRKYVVAVIAALVVIVVGGSLLAGPGGQQASPTPDPYEEEPIPITAKGTIQPVRQAKLSFRAAGQIALLPKIGDKVEEGQEIGKLDTSELDLAVAQAGDAVAINLAALAQAEAPARQVDLAAAQAAYEGALAQHNQLLAGPTSAELEAAKKLSQKT